MYFEQTSLNKAQVFSILFAAVLKQQSSC